MIDVWTLVRFLHVVGAALWVGGQLTVSLVVLPPIRRLLDPEQRSLTLRAVGRRFARATLAGFLAVQVTTGWLLAWRHAVTWQSLTELGYGSVLAAKLALFAFVMLSTSLHGILHGRRHRLSRAASVAALVGSLGIVLLAVTLVTG